MQGDVPGSQSIVKVWFRSESTWVCSFLPCSAHKHTQLAVVPFSHLAMSSIAGQPVTSFPRSVYSGRRKDKNRMPWRKSLSGIKRVVASPTALATWVLLFYCFFPALSHRRDCYISFLQEMERSADLPWFHCRLCQGWLLIQQCWKPAVAVGMDPKLLQSPQSRYKGNTAKQSPGTLWQSFLKCLLSDAILLTFPIIWWDRPGWFHFRILFCLSFSCFVICGAVISEVKLFKYHTAVTSTKCCDLLFGFIRKMIQKKKYSVFQLQC